MSCDLVTGFRRGPSALWLATILAILAGGCSSNGDGPETTVLTSRRGDTSIQVTESERDGSQLVKINTTFRGEENEIVLLIDQAVYEVEIPLSLEQIQPRQAASGGAAAAGGGGDFQDLLIAQYLEKAQEAMLKGDYNGALRQVNLVLLVRPEHVQTLTMKGSIYYAMGNYRLANDQWEQVLAVDPSNREVVDFVEFIKNREAGSAPPPPGAPSPGVQTPAAPEGAEGVSP